MRLFTLVLIVLIAAGCGGLGVGYARWHTPNERLQARREAAIIDHGKQVALARAVDAPPGGTVVFGTSVTERQNFTILCGRPVLNAGVSRAKARDIVEIAPRVLALTKPRQVVLELGPNDFLLTPNTDLNSFTKDMEALLSQVGERPVIVGMTADLPANAVLRRLAVRYGGTFVPGVPAAMTEDGVHLNGIGRREWKRRVAAACA